MLCDQDEEESHVYGVVLCTYVSPAGLVTHTDKKILFEKGEIRHEARRVELWSNNSHKSVVLLTNNLELDVKDLEEIYKHRWAIESLYKQLKQNWLIA